MKYENDFKIILLVRRIHGNIKTSQRYAAVVTHRRLRLNVTFEYTEDTITQCHMTVKRAALPAIGGVGSD